MLPCSSLDARQRCDVEKALHNFMHGRLIHLLPDVESSVYLLGANTTFTNIMVSPSVTQLHAYTEYDSLPIFQIYAACSSRLVLKQRKAHIQEML